MNSIGFSATVLKRIRRLNKDELVQKLVDLSNYAENQKAANGALHMMLREFEEKVKTLEGKINDLQKEKEGSTDANATR